MKKLLDSKPDVAAFMASCKKDLNFLKVLGINPDDIKTLKDLTDLMMLMNALKGERASKDYIDEQYDREASLEAMNETAD